MSARKLVRKTKSKQRAQYDPTFTMRLPSATLLQLKGLAEGRGVPPTTMARMLLLDAIKERTGPNYFVLDVLGAIIERPRLRSALQALVRGDKESLREAQSLLLRDALERTRMLDLEDCVATPRRRRRSKR